MLDLKYAAEVPPPMRDLIEYHGRRLGVPLGDLEHVGQSLDLAEGFLLAAEQGRGLEYARAAATGVPLPRAPLVTLVSLEDPRARA